DSLIMPRGQRRLVWVAPSESRQVARAAALIIGGLGCYPADQPFNSNEAQRALAHGLARAGWITLRVEKSGAGDSEGPPCTAEPMATEIEGLVAGLRWLKSQPAVDAARVVIVGLSMGGIVAPQVAAKESVAGIAAFEIVGGTTWFEYELDNRRRQLLLRGQDAASVADAVRLRAECMARLFLARQARADVLAAQPACERELRYPVGDAYMTDVFTMNPVRDWLATKMPVLLVVGGADFITSLDQHTRLRDALNAHTPGRAHVERIEDMDHWLSRAANQAESFDRAVNRGQPIGLFHDTAAQVLLRWLNAQVKQQSSPLMTR
ncbi:MAG: alpha/beta hydrolase family protein, partial [Burkholderiaceae bacterium]